MLWWAHNPVVEDSAECKRARRRERSERALQHLLPHTPHWPHVSETQVSCSRCGKQTHRRSCARWLRTRCPGPVTASGIFPGSGGPNGG
eukprot:9381532-Pyramimonas_sp.AAC.1